MVTTSKAGQLRPRIRTAMAALLLMTTVSGCGMESLPNPFARDDGANPGAGAAEVAAPGGRDIEAPQVFETTEAGLWDGRPSLGGIWVAHPDVTDPERVLIRNRATGRSVTGALFKRERESPGPTLQVSSEAAEALGMLAGQPAELSVVALRRAGSPPAEAMPGGAEPAGAIAAGTAGARAADGAMVPTDSAAPPPQTPSTPPPLGRPDFETGAARPDRDAAEGRRAAGWDPAVLPRIPGAGGLAALPDRAGPTGGAAAG